MAAGSVDRVQPSHHVLAQPFSQAFRQESSQEPSNKTKQLKLQRLRMRSRALRPLTSRSHRQRLRRDATTEYTDRPTGYADGGRTTTSGEKSADNRRSTNCNGFLGGSLCILSTGFLSIFEAQRAVFGRACTTIATTRPCEATGSQGDGSRPIQEPDYR